MHVIRDDGVDVCRCTFVGARWSSLQRKFFGL